MLRAFIIADEAGQVRDLGSNLGQMGCDCFITSDGEELAEQILEQAPDLVFIAVNSTSPISVIRPLSQRIKQLRNLPVIALLSKQSLDRFDFPVDINDFVIEPWNAAEVMIRAKQILWQTSKIDNENLIKYGDLVIDLAKCEVSLSGKLIELTFKEYELLRFLASNEGKVFTRDALLNRIWGYDYFGGDRTVDVHIRRLRSKVEDSKHSFIETVRNIGYKFKHNL